MSIPCTILCAARHPGPSGNKGLFTSTNPELRRVVPDNVAGRVKVKVVYTVLEAQYQSALSAGELGGRTAEAGTQRHCLWFGHVVVVVGGKQAGARVRKV